MPLEALKRLPVPLARPPAGLLACPQLRLSELDSDEGAATVAKAKQAIANALSGGRLPALAMRKTRRPARGREESGEGWASPQLDRSMGSRPFG